MGQTGSETLVSPFAPPAPYLPEFLTPLQVPEEVANKLKNNIPVVPEIFDSVSVLHADILNFTILSSNHSGIRTVPEWALKYSCIPELGLEEGVH